MDAILRGLFTLKKYDFADIDIRSQNISQNVVQYANDRLSLITDKYSELYSIKILFDNYFKYIKNKNTTIKHMLHLYLPQPIAEEIDPLIIDCLSI